MGLRDLAVDTTPFRRVRPFRIITTSFALSSVGSRLTDVAIPVQVYALTHSTLAVGLLGLVMLPARLGLSVFGGALADRSERRRIMLVCEAAGALCSAGLALNAFAGRPSLAAIYVLVFVSSAAHSLSVPAHRSTIPIVVPPELLTSAFALQAVVGSSSWLIGPAVFGLCGGNVRIAFVIDVVSYLASFACLLRLAPIGIVGDQGEQTTFGAIAEGLRSLRSNAPVLGAIAMDLNAMIFGLPTALFPAVVVQRFHGAGYAYSLLYAAPFAGTLVASATSGWTRRIRRHGWAITLSVVAWGGAIIGFGVVRGLLVSVLFIALAGAADMVSGVFRMAVHANATPPEMLGRIEGASMAVWSGGPALGDLEAGGLARLTSVDTSIWVGGLACVVVAGILIGVLRGFRTYVRPPLPGEVGERTDGDGALAGGISD